MCLRDKWSFSLLLPPSEHLEPRNKKAVHQSRRKRDLTQEIFHRCSFLGKSWGNKARVGLNAFAKAFHHGV
jgi:hypothetical protein